MELESIVLTLLLIVPALGAGLVAMVRRNSSARIVALVVTLVNLSLALLALSLYDRSATGYGLGGTVQLAMRVDWIPILGSEFFLGVDGVSLMLVLLTAGLFPLSVGAAWKLTERPKAFFALMLLLEAGLIGSFVALDLVLFYVFFEVSLLPMYLLIGMWGGEQRQKAAIKFFLYTLVGSVALLAALICVYLHSRQVVPDGTFDLIRLAQPDIAGSWQTLVGASWVLPAAGVFGLMLFGFAVKLPIAPLHTWLPDAHVQAPTAVSMILAGVVLKLGGYGMYRVAWPLLPQVAFDWAVPLAVLGAATILYAALVCLAQSDFKRMVAISSVAHMGYVLLGLSIGTPAAVSGALYMMLAHGVVSAMLFMCGGIIEYRLKHRTMGRMGGLATLMPVHAAFQFQASFANLGLPGLAVFVAEVLVVLGLISAALGTGNMGLIVASVMVICAIVISAAYNLRSLSLIFFGTARSEHAAVADLKSHEVVVLSILALLVLAMGVLPGFMALGLMEQSIQAYLSLAPEMLVSGQSGLAK